jgi:DNA (cytosine-5)-methyltransferase 1
VCGLQGRREAGDIVRPRLLDLFCGAGGCSVGYDRAGFDVVGVDIEPHPDYPFALIVEDALESLSRPAWLAKFDVIHASPPCQARTTMSNRWRGKGGAADQHVNLIPEVRDALLQWGGPYVIENVPGARRDLRHPITLHGGMFGLGVYRPRLFESNVGLMVYSAPPPENPLGVYGREPDGGRIWTRADGTEQRRAKSVEQAQQAMGTPWMTDFRDIAESIPPAYTEYLGGQLLDALEAAA